MKINCTCFCKKGLTRLTPTPFQVFSPPPTLTTKKSFSWRKSL